MAHLTICMDSSNDLAILKQLFHFMLLYLWVIQLGEAATSCMRLPEECLNP